MPFVGQCASRSSPLGPRRRTSRSRVCCGRRALGVADARGSARRAPSRRCGARAPGRAPDVLDGVDEQGVWALGALRGSSRRRSQRRIGALRDPRQAPDRASPPSRGPAPPMDGTRQAGSAVSGGAASRRGRHRSEVEEGDHAVRRRGRPQRGVGVVVRHAVAQATGRARPGSWSPRGYEHFGSSSLPGADRRRDLPDRSGGESATTSRSVVSAGPHPAPPRGVRARTGGNTCGGSLSISVDPDANWTVIELNGAVESPRGCRPAGDVFAESRPSCTSRGQPSSSSSPTTAA